MDASFTPSALGWNLGIDLNAASVPEGGAALTDAQAATQGHLAAWDPVAQREVWRAQFEEPWFGGVLSTAGDLVFQGTARGELVAYEAKDGTRLWSAPTQAGVLAPPISYSVDGEQYIALEVGWGVLPGLRHAAALGDAPQWNEIVIGGVRTSAGMAGFADELSPEASEKVRAYVVARASARF